MTKIYFMALSIYQLALQRYFRQSIHRFINSLSNGKTQTILSKEETSELILKFLDQELRYDLNLYEKQTQGYDYILDLLIETHITTPGEFIDTLVIDLSKSFHHV